ncbi:hypothetical protein [Winogradskyella sp. 3972H.M.0a.05]|uniref:hypothetical protein n=1 Tax=Winogradskyella sp. 3972H.M.0a.05 TaxID=2950277 RepID=UPI0033943098
MNKIKYILFFLGLPLIMAAQDSQLSVFDNLVDKTWYAEGKWGDGSAFKQEVTFEYDLGKAIVTAKSKGFVDAEQTKIGDRNLGIRKFDKSSNTIKFWEFDVFGGVTEGTVMQEGKNIVYQYKYGTSIVTDMWEYVDDSTYNFKVGSYKDGKWEQVYLSTKFIQKK